MNFYRYADRKPRPRPVRAFTLPELLVTLAIVVILTAIAYPAFFRAIEQSNKTESAANLRQIGVGIQLYIGDNAMSLPPVSSAGQTPPRWTRLIMAYMGGPSYSALDDRAGNAASQSFKGFKCRADKVKRVDRNDSPCSYGLNFAVQSGDVTGALPALKASAVQQVAQTIIVGERWHANNTVNNALGMDASRSADNFNGGSNYLLMDGSVLFLAQRSTLTPVNLWSFSK